MHSHMLYFKKNVYVCMSILYLQKSLRSALRMFQLQASEDTLGKSLEFISFNKVYYDIKAVKCT